MFNTAYKSYPLQQCMQKLSLLIGYTKFSYSTHEIAFVMLLQRIKKFVQQCIQKASVAIVHTQMSFTIVNKNFFIVHLKVIHFNSSRQWLSIAKLYSATQNVIYNRTYREGEMKIMHRSIVNCNNALKNVHSNFANKTCQLQQCIQKL